MEIFKQQLLTTLDEMCKSNNIRVTTAPITKQNDVELTAICLTPEDGNIGSNYYLEDLYEKFQNGQTVAEIATRLLIQNKNDTVHTKNSFLTSFVSHLHSYEFVKNHLSVRLLNLRRNSSYLSDKVYVPYLKSGDDYELAICFGIHVPRFNGNEGTITITHHLRSQWDVTDEQLLEDAIANTEKVQGKKTRNLYELLTSLSIPTDSFRYLLDEPVVSMYAMSNKSSFNGAATILYKDALKTFAEEKGLDIFVIPSSVHEVILVPDDGTIPAGYIQRMIAEVNQTQLSPSEILSDQLLYYSRKDDCISICATQQWD